MGFVAGGGSEYRLTESYRWHSSTESANGCIGHSHEQRAAAKREHEPEVRLEPRAHGADVALEAGHQQAEKHDEGGHHDLRGGKSEWGRTGTLNKNARDPREVLLPAARTEMRGIRPNSQSVLPAARSPPSRQALGGNPGEPAGAEKSPY